MLKRNRVSVGITHFDGRKKPCLYILEGNTMTKVASINSEETAEWFKEKMMQMFDGLIEVEDEEGWRRYIND